MSTQQQVLVSNILNNNFFDIQLGGIYPDFFQYITFDVSNNIYVTGQENSSSSGGRLIIAKYNSSGTIQWQRNLGGAVSSNDSIGNSCVIDSAGNVYVTGSSTITTTAGGRDLLVTKYNSSGTIQWQRILGGSVADAGNSITIDTSDNIYVLGFTASQGAGGNDALIVKYNSSGTIQWQRSLGGASTEVANYIAIDSGNNIYITGSSNSTGGAGLQDLFIAKYNSSGTIQWQRSLGGASNDTGYGIAVDSSDNIYIAGRTGSQGQGSLDILIAKYNSSGTIQWQRALGTINDEEGFGIAIDSLNNIYITGRTQNTNTAKLIIAKYNSSGAIQWQRAFGEYPVPANNPNIAGDDQVNHINIDANDNIYIVGQTTAQGAGQADAFIFKCGSNGRLIGKRNNLTYMEANLVDVATTLTDQARTLTDAARTLTDQASTYTDAATTLTSTTNNW